MYIVHRYALAATVLIDVYVCCNNKLAASLQLQVPVARLVLVRCTECSLFATRAAERTVELLCNLYDVHTCMYIVHRTCAYHVRESVRIFV